MKNQKTGKVRLAVLSLMLIFITYEAVMHQIKGGGPEGAPSIHALCPYGGLESLYTIFSSGTFIDKIYSGTLGLFIITALLALLFNRGFCGWLCPFGALQELLGKLGGKVFLRKMTMPVHIDRILRYLKYPVLVFTLILSWKTASMWVSPYDPWAAYGHLGEGISSLWTEFTIGTILLAVTLIGSFFYNRFFCKYLCPMGGFLGLFSLISLSRIRRDKEKCMNCNLCSLACPMNIDVATAEKVGQSECINCQECTSVCSSQGTLENRFINRFPIKPLTMGLLILTVFAAGLGIIRISGSDSFLPAAIDETTVIVDVDNLKGYMTIAEISSLTGIPLEEVYRRMEIPEYTPSGTPMKEIGEYLPEFEFHKARETLAE